MYNKITTKHIILLTTFMIGLCAIISLGVFLTVVLENHGGLSGWRAEAISGSICMTCIGGLTAMTATFMDNRTRKLRYDYRTMKRYIKYLKYIKRHPGS